VPDDFVFTVANRGDRRACGDDDSSIHAGFLAMLVNVGLG
jgi:hypothetical protein